MALSAAGQRAARSCSPRPQLTEQGDQGDHATRGGVDTGRSADRTLDSEGVGGGGAAGGGAS